MMLLNLYEIAPSCLTSKTSSIAASDQNTSLTIQQISNRLDLVKLLLEDLIQNLKTGTTLWPKTLGQILGCCIAEFCSIQSKQPTNRTRY